MKKRTIEVSEETYESIKDQLQEEEKIDINELKDFEGKKMFFRTVTYHILGKVEKVLGNGQLQLSTASWIADSGRFSDAVKNGSLEEIEPLGDWFVNLHSCTDYGFWKHELPKTQK